MLGFLLRGVTKALRALQRVSQSYTVIPIDESMETFPQVMARRMVAGLFEICAWILDLIPGLHPAVYRSTSNELVRLINRLRNAPLGEYAT